MPPADEFTDSVLKAVFSKMPASRLTRDEIASTARQSLKKLKLPPPPKSAAYQELKKLPGFDLLFDELLPSELEITTHLKLLAIWRRLRDNVKAKDGLFGIYNSFVNADMSKMFDRAEESRGRVDLAKPPDIRWSVYVSRAVERYTRWFNSFPKSESQARPELYLEGTVCAVGEGNLPPIDVLMVWMVHMLHPRFYWEDCVRCGKQGLFQNTGVPWEAIDAVIKVTGDPKKPYIYEPSEESIRTFELLTRTAFKNDDEKHLEKPIMCPSCRKPDVSVPFYAAFHHGFAEDDFTAYCPACGSLIDRINVGAMLFLDDFERCQTDGFPMRGTLLDYLGGTALAPPDFVNGFLANSFTADRLKPQGLVSGMLDIKSTIRDDAQKMRKQSRKKQPYVIDKSSLIAIRKTLFHYFYNTSQFDLELEEALANQSGFVDMMEAYGYVSSPYRPIVVNRSVERLLRFFCLLQQEKDKPLAPPNDVDLAWHTLQLSPAKYMAVCFVLVGTHIDHDDSGGKVMNQDAEVRGNKRWKKQFPNDDLGYNECTCVFCETSLQFGFAKPSKSSQNGSSSKSGKGLFSSSSSGKRSMADGINVDYEYRRACAAAVAKGRKDVVELSSVENMSTPGKASAPQHPYFAYLPPVIDGDAPADAFKGAVHSNHIDYLGVPRCFTIY
ncbi:hypothetical protein BZA70DRAFT_102602 [Myxozyma melibiosi]|uniref:Uncharacterized protein n=1 Tax=Myxozyma melibiosi TaxID=54550 RepID=A0ABR1EY30_9ASCO